jgi:hypothetical protein
VPLKNTRKLSWSPALEVVRQAPYSIIRDPGLGGEACPSYTMSRGFAVMLMWTISRIHAQEKIDEHLSLGNKICQTRTAHGAL